MKYILAWAMPFMFTEIAIILFSIFKKVEAEKETGYYDKSYVFMMSNVYIFGFVSIFMIILIIITFWLSLIVESPYFAMELSILSKILIISLIHIIYAILITITINVYKWIKEIIENGKIN